MRRFLFRILAFVRFSRAEADLAREINSHLQLLEDRFVAQGMSLEEARFAARRAFGGQVEQIKERQRDARGFRVLDQWWLDVTLAVRMLVRYPGLTAVAGLGMAVAIAISVGAFSIINGMLDTTLPLHEGDRIVAIQNWDAAHSIADRRALHDLAAWREELSALTDVGAFRQVSRTLIADGMQPEVVRVAEISAAAFRVARVAPIIGRYLADADEHAGAPPVLVIGHAAWRTRFSNDPDIVGRAVQLGATTYTVVGVMPEGFAFPVNHQYWVPLAEDPSRYEPGQGPEIWVFARLAPGATRESAQAQLTTIGQRFAAAFPSTHEHLRPQVLPYTFPLTDMDEPENLLTLRLMQFLVALLLGVVSVNVALLVYARTATRHAEIAVRSALGAGRRRIVAQLFVEALALALVAATLGVAIAALALNALDDALIQIAGQLPFWMDFSLTAGGLIYTLLLAVTAAAIVGVVPALKATGPHVQNQLKGVSAGGGAGMRLGKMWTGLVVAQVAVAVALLPTAIYHAWDATRHGVSDVGFAAHEFLAAQLVLDRGFGSDASSDRANREFMARLADRHIALMQRVQPAPDVAGVTFALHAPGFEPTAWIAVDGVATPTAPDDYRIGAGSSLGHPIRFNRIDLEWFTVFQVPLLGGRSFSGVDADPSATSVVVNRTFIDDILRGENPIGRRFRYVGVSADARPDDVNMARWYEIVGVVADFPVNALATGMARAKVYHAVAPGQLHPVHLAVRVRSGDATAVTARLLQTTAALDSNLQLRNLSRLDHMLLQEQSFFRIIAAALVLLTLSVVALSAAGIFALMSCIVEQRRKEIGIRAALGADPRRILAAIFARALGQLATGAACGVAVALMLDTASEGDLMAGHASLILPIVAAFMMAVGLVAAWGPARRGLRIHPTETLRAE